MIIYAWRNFKKENSLRHNALVLCDAFIFSVALCEINMVPIFAFAIRNVNENLTIKKNKEN